MKGTIYENIKKIVGCDVVMPFGDTGSGKSKLCYTVAKELLEAGGKVVFLDTERNLPDEEIAKLGAAYRYTPIFEEIKDQIATLPKVDLVVVDSIGMPIYIRFSRLRFDQRLRALQEMGAILGDLKDWSYKNQALAIVTNQPISEFMEDEIRRGRTRTWGNGYQREPFGGKSKHVCKELWQMRRFAGDQKSTRVVITAHRSRQFPTGFVIAEGVINNEGLRLDFKLAPTISEDTIADLLAAIQGAGTLSELAAMGEKVASISLGENQRLRLRKAYRKRQAELKPRETLFEEQEERHEGEFEPEGEEAEGSRPGDSLGI